MNVLAINARAVRLMLPYISTEETRYYLQGVHFQAHQAGTGCYAVATDGHKLGVAYDPTALVHDWSEKPVTITKDIARALKPTRDDVSDLGMAHNLSANDVQTNADSGRYFVVRGDLTMVVLALNAGEALQAQPGDRLVKAVSRDCEIDGTYPDWQRCVPREYAETMAPDAFGCHYIKAIADGYAKATDSRSHAAMMVTSAGIGSPALIRFDKPSDNPVDFFAILMPMRSGGHLGELPAWFAEPALTPEQAEAA